jgi:anti-sigma B factor antagonist
MDLVQTQSANGLTRVSLNGSFDVSGASGVDHQFSDIGKQAIDVLVDLSGVTFLASVGVHILIRTAKAVGERGGQLIILNPNVPSRKVLHATGVDSIILLADNEADALAKLG